MPASYHKNNNDEAPLDDIENFVTALHADQTDRDAWRSNLQETFDMEGFADYYAVNQLIANWDTYGGFAHNFYLYGDPDQGGQLKIIGWDYDLSFDGTGGSDFSLESFDGTWPLLQALARDPVFMRRYLDTMDEVLAAEFESGVLLARVDAYEALIAPAVAREAPGQNGFASALVSLRRHIGEQQERAQDYVEAVGVR